MSVCKDLRGYALGALGALLILACASSARADTAVSSCGTLSSPGTYFLTTNLTSSGTCLIVTSEGVAIDLKGHTITGDGSGDGISDGDVGFESMAIVNGKIRNFNRGVGLGESCCVVIANLDSSNNTGDGIVIGNCCSILDSVKANSNGGNGIVASDCCYTINQVQANNNGGGGIVAAANGCCTTVSNSTVTGNGGTGVFEQGCCSFLVKSTVKNNGADGVDMDDCCNFVVNSTVSGNGGAGVHMIDDDNLVSGAKVSGNGGDGIFLRNRQNQITNSKSTGNGGVGANVACSGAITGLNAKGNSGGSLTLVDTGNGDCTQLNNKL